MNGIINGIIFDIKEFSVHDGPGVRTTVFMKGCPLSCKWCHNPEGLSPKPELMVRTARCKHCGRCMQPCEHDKCKPFDRCIDACPDGLISICGQEWDSDRLAAKLLQNADFMQSSGGGVTISGGEPTLQAEFVAELLGKLSSVHRAIETCGYCTGERFMSVINNADFVMMDIKIADPEHHKQYCGVDNAPILENFKRLRDSGKPHLIRIPLIPDITDTYENLSAISKIVGDSPVEMLGYNSFAGAKYEGVGRVYTLPNKPNREIDVSIFKNAKLSK
ncbi:MAG: glycyl-radical enzyme activating protein [Clostridiales bacterium]|nr:glycyl-radical enzyme activating protein [Clostridiales bacterium]